MDRVPNGNYKATGTYVVIDSDSDSDAEGFVEEVTPIHTKSDGKAPSNSLKTGGKATFSKGAASYGKTYSAGKRGKASMSNAVPTKSNTELKLELDIPPNSRMLMNCEAAELLQEIHEHMAILSEDPMIKIPESFDKVFQYAKEGTHFTTADAVKQALDPLKKCGVNDGEVCMIANIGPETVEEVYALVPSLKADKSLNKGPITEALAALAKIKKAN
jgi:DNA-directed RNA polymerase II subunit RPB4